MLSGLHVKVYVMTENT